MQIISESKGNIETMRRTESVMVLCYHILAPWLCIKLGPLGECPMVRAWPSPRHGHPLPLSYTPLAAKNRLGFVD
jgi:hypothetical protein